MFASHAFAIDLLVYNTNNGGSGSLRQAVSDNNALGGGNTIVFSNVVTGTIPLTSGELLITSNVTILGPGANVLTINGNAASRVFHVTNAIATISGLTITNGHATGSFPANVGGGIYSELSTLTISDCVLSGNSAGSAATVGSGGGIYSELSTLAISNCVLSGNSAGNEGSGGNGGGIYSFGEFGSASLTVIASTISRNSAGGGGGGIYNDGEAGSATLRVVASTLSSNSVTGGSDGGGIYNDGGLGSAILTVSNSTFCGNSAPYGGDGVANDGSGGSATLTMVACTLSGHAASESGGIINNSSQNSGSATLEIGNTILDAGAFGGTIFNNAGTVISDGYNLSSDNGGGVLTGLADQTGIDPMLGPLRDNGGPTWTMALLAGSTAIDAGKSFGLTADQRGAPRPHLNPNTVLPLGGDGSDIGAFELGNPKLDIHQVGSSAVLSWPSYYGGFSLQSATNVTSSNSWALAGGSAYVVGNQYQQTNNPISGNRFFRLLGN